MTHAMSTPNDDLIRELRQAARKDSMFGEDVRKHLCERAADALVQLGELEAWRDLKDGECYEVGDRFADGKEWAVVDPVMVGRTYSSRTSKVTQRRVFAAAKAVQ